MRVGVALSRKYIKFRPWASVGVLASFTDSAALGLEPSPKRGFVEVAELNVVLTGTGEQDYVTIGSRASR